MEGPRFGNRRPRYCRAGGGHTAALGLMVAPSGAAGAGGSRSARRRSVDRSQRDERLRRGTEQDVVESLLMTADNLP